MGGGAEDDIASGSTVASEECAVADEGSTGMGATTTSGELG